MKKYFAHEKKNNTKTVERTNRRKEKMKEGRVIVEELKEKMYKTR